MARQPIGEATAEVVEKVKEGRAVTNYHFDKMFPNRVRKFSRRHWTPVPVAIRAAQLLVTAPTVTVLDVGSGPGKFCLIGAIATDGNFVGVERRKTLVEVARRTVRSQNVPRVRFIHGNMADLDWTPFDAFYLYNPFYENVEPSAQIDEQVAMGEEYFDRYVKIVEEKLMRLRSGSRVATYHGFGGQFPAGFRQAVKEPFGGDYLELWIKETD
jgi:SAM-dependent methyltransferase